MGQKSYGEPGSGMGGAKYNFYSTRNFMATDEGANFPLNFQPCRPTFAEHFNSLNCQLSKIIDGTWHLNFIS